ncbi:uncharacterized protein LOC123530848 isoform X1 [Mercenaria mercenaria]|uniref:uncharacterized protein LOC123530848 isoform X1 n=2 Tax=Mercenaria mercenaria TaxID=6596 RepID=UPI00234EDABB|nr:uncharacterized protein LOC123530848 isoform X1 [Mercenaria mercenaria]
MDPDQTVRMHRLVWIRAGRKATMLVFPWHGSNVFSLIALYKCIVSIRVMYCVLHTMIITCLGDGRMDSPGHSAQYCTYTLMENDTKDLLCSIIIDKRMTDLKSTNMEKEGLIRGLRTLRENRVVVKELVTDASTTIAAMMKNQYPDITHTFDTWHGAKNFGKKIGAVSSL